MAVERRPSLSLRELLASPGIIRLPGVYDALTARIAISAGFDGLYMSGFAVAGSLIGQPDIGLVTATEMADRASQICHCSGSIPVVADGDNGYGGPLNVTRLVQAYEQAGVSCIQLEDQVSPKRCGHMSDKKVVSLADAVTNIRAAVAARSSPDFLVMARTDARATDGLSEALRRGEAFADAGADILFIEAPLSVAEMQEICQHFPEIPLVANMVEDGRTPYLDPGQLDDIGYRLVLYPISALLAVTRLLQTSYASLYKNGKLEPAIPRASFAEFNAEVGLDALRQLESSFEDD